jgi:hypothetical protein
MALIALIFATGTVPSLALENTPASTSPSSASHSKFYGSFSIPTSFSFHAPNTGFSPDPDHVLPDNLWTSGLGIGIGFETPLFPRLSSFLEMELVTMDINQVLAFNMGATKNAATFLNVLAGLKMNWSPSGDFNPYLAGGIGFSSARVEEIIIWSSFDDIPEFQDLRFLARIGIGADIRVEKDILTFVEFQMYDFDASRFFVTDNTAVMNQLKGGVRLEI